MLYLQDGGYRIRAFNVLRIVLSAAVQRRILTIFALIVPSPYRFGSVLDFGMSFNRFVPTQGQSLTVYLLFFNTIMMITRNALRAYYGVCGSTGTSNCGKILTKRTGR
jgi:hypothetical protein